MTDRIARRKTLELIKGRLMVIILVISTVSSGTKISPDFYSYQKQADRSHSIYQLRTELS